MASDDNPFARNSVWPKMPQAPFRVGALPKAPRQDGAQPAPRKITPLFVRPVDAEALAPPMFGEAAAVLVPIPPEVRAAPSPEPPAELTSEPPPPAPVELATLFVEPPRRSKPGRRRSLMPALVAAAVGVAGLGGLAMLLSGVQKAALKAGAPSPAPTAVTAQPAAVPPVQAGAVEAARAPAPTAEPPLVRLVIPKPPAVPGPSPIRARARGPVQAAPLAADDVAAAVEQTLSAPPLVLRPALQTPAPSPAERPEPAVRDPDAPMTTRSPYS